MKSRIVVPWLPKRLFAFSGKHWVPTGGWAWLRPVFRVVTFWDEIYFVSIEHHLSSKPFTPKTTKPAEAGSEGQGA